MDAAHPGRNPTKQAGPFAIEGRKGWGIVSAVLVAELLILMGLKLPAIARFEGFAFADWGANLTVQVLLDQGMRPGQDFYYPYGLLPLAVGRLWYGVLGRTPMAYLSAIAVCQVLTGVAIARFCTSNWVGRGGVAVAIIATPILVPPTHPNLSHAMETVLLAFALAEQARGCRSRALLLATLAVLSKPSLAYPSGLVILAGIAAELGRNPHPIVPRIARMLGPAAVVGLGSLLLLPLWFGVEAVHRTLFPFQAASIHQEVGYGFFYGSGRRFWQPIGAGPGHYLGTVRGFWLASSLILCIGGAIAFLRLLRGKSKGKARDGDESILSCAVLHALFVGFFFASEFSWVYYGFVLLMGLSGIAGRLRGRVGLAFTIAVVLVGLLTLRTFPREIVELWKSSQRAPITQGLWTTPNLAREWSRVRELTEGHPTAILSWAGASELFEPDRFGPPVRFFILPGMSEHREIDRLADRVASSEFVVRPKASSQGFVEALEAHPRIREAMRGAEPVFLGRAIDVYRRPTETAPPYQVGDREP